MKKINFCSGWEFCKEGEAFKPVTLPFDGMIGEKRAAENKSGSGGGYFPGGKYVYKKTFDRPNCQRVILGFDGVYGITKVLLNGKEICANRYGYNDFYADISNELNDCNNELQVVVDNTAQPNSRWYAGSGIYRPVWLYTGGETVIERGGVKITTPQAAKDVSRVDVELKLSCAAPSIVTIETEVFDGHKSVYKEVTPFTFFEKGCDIARQRLYLQHVKLWSPEKPNLYSCKIKLLSAAGEVLDEACERFGVREVTLDPVHGLRINGKKMLLRGACIHHDNGVIGANEYFDACYRRIKIMKGAGFNAVRISHHPASVDMLDACDELGMLVWDETFDMWEESKNEFDFSNYFDDDWEAVTDNMVDKDYNHPSVIIYSIGNEIPEIVKPRGIELGRKISERIRKKDDTRIIANAINGLCATGGQTIPVLIDLGVITKEQIDSVTGGKEMSEGDVFGLIMKAAAGGGGKDINELMMKIAGNMGRVVEHPQVGERLQEPLASLDMGGYNYMKARYPIDAKNTPNKIMVGSETTPPDIDILWNYVKNINQLIGDFTWTGWDYLGEAGVGHTNYTGKAEFAAPYPAYIAYCGDMDITGYRRPLSYLREIVFGLRKKPYISVQNPKYFNSPVATTAWAEPETVESWTWGDEEKQVKVSVYSAADEVELFVNDKSVGKQKVVRNRASFVATYAPGSVRAVDYIGGKKAGTSEIVSASAPYKLNVKLSKTKVKKGGLCYVEMQITGANGVKVMNADCAVSVSVSGCELLGFGTADPCATSNFSDTVQTTFNGRALAVLRCNEVGEGKIVVDYNGKKIEKNIEVTE